MASDKASRHIRRTPTTATRAILQLGSCMQESDILVLSENSGQQGGGIYRWFCDLHGEYVVGIRQYVEVVDGQVADEGK